MEGLLSTGPTLSRYIIILDLFPPRITSHPSEFKEQAGRGFLRLHIFCLCGYKYKCVFPVQERALVNASTVQTLEPNFQIC